MLILLGVYDELKEYLTMAEAFESCFEKHSEFAKENFCRPLLFNKAIMPMKAYSI